MLAFAIVSPATESAPDKDLRRLTTATCELNLRDARSRPSAFSAPFWKLALSRVPATGPEFVAAAWRDVTW